MGGVFNVVNLHLYHYAGNNPVKYEDPDGRIVRSANSSIMMADSSDNLGTSQEKILVLPKELWPDALNVEDAGFNLQENLLPALETPRYGWPDNNQIIVIGDAKSANSVLL